MPMRSHFVPASTVRTSIRRSIRRSIASPAITAITAIGAIGAIVGFGAAPAIAGPLSGTFASPLGAVAVSENESGTVKAVIADKKNPCNLPKGAVVLEGSRLDDSVVGTVHSCKVGDGCAGPIDGDAMLLITRAGGAMSGAVHFGDKTCHTPLNGDSIMFKKGASSSSSTASSTKKVEPKPKGTPRERALFTIGEGKKLLDQGDAEGARAKFQEAATTDPASAEAFVGVGVTYYARERYDEAMDWYKKAIDANPGVPDSYYNMACVYALKSNKAQDPKEQADMKQQALRYIRIALMNGYVDLKTLEEDEKGDLKSLVGDATFEKYKKGQTD